MLCGEDLTNFLNDLNKVNRRHLPEESELRCLLTPKLRQSITNCAGNFQRSEGRFEEQTISGSTSRAVDLAHLFEVHWNREIHERMHDLPRAIRTIVDILQNETENKNDDLEAWNQQLREYADDLKYIVDELERRSKYVTWSN